jgi:hypothetical protein
MAKVIVSNRIWGRRGFAFDAAASSKQLDARRALEAWLSASIPKQSDADHAIELLNAYADAIGGGEAQDGPDVQGNGRLIGGVEAQDRRGMGLDAVRVPARGSAGGGGKLDKLFSEFKPPQHL